ncbi:MAG: hypothetical protein AABZ60_04400 [Planctomycetota bacterium]
METLEQTSITEKIIKGLRKAAIELEEFRLQSALGKAEAHDAYEKAKKIFNKYVHEAKLKLGAVKGVTKEKSIQLKAEFEWLQVWLALGKAETQEAFEEQQKSISKALNDIETRIKKNKTTDLYYAELQMEIEKFRIKLDILKLQFELRKLGVREEFEEKKKDFSKILSDIKKQLLKKEEDAESTWEHFRDEISDAYSHLKKAFVR